MQYCLLGSSPLTISTIGFGCMSLPTDEKQSMQLLQAALDRGINFFDTADLYNRGQNEEWVGKALKHQRQKAIIATKVGNQWRTDGNGWDWNPSKAYIIKAAEESLRRLQTDYIDLYQLHGGTIDDPIDETVSAFEQLKQQGKIRCYGISSIRPNVIREWTKHASLTSVMMQYSLLDRRPEETALPLLQAHHIPVLVRGSLAQGLLAGKPAKPYLTLSEDQVTAAKQQLDALAGKEGASNLAVQFVLRQPAVASAIIGIRTATQLEDAVAAANHPAFLSDEQWTALQNGLPQIQYSEHR